MCGIVGIIDLEKTVNPDILLKMCQLISHRGPDDSGIFLENTSKFSIGLGSLRLSILDLSLAGHMPMKNRTGDIVLVYNGEIYNHNDLKVDLEKREYLYHSRTDTETLLYAYEEFGLDCFKKLNGMFALAIYDRINARVVLARDRMGIKPLYYFWNGKRLIFSSELKSLMTHPDIIRKLNPKALDLYLTFGYVPSPYCLIAGVKKLLPGHYMVLQEGILKDIPFWTPTLSIPNPDLRDDRQLSEQIRATLDGAVETQLMSDVPVGIMLSGGLDSTIIAAIASRKQLNSLHTFSVGFETGKSRMEEMYNWDSFYAKKVALKLKTQHHEVLIKDDSTLIQLLEKLLFALDEPVWEPSYLSIYAMSILAKEEGVKVLLSGDGSDELFGGYPWYLGATTLEKYERIPFLRQPLRLASSILPSSIFHKKVTDLYLKYRQPNYIKYLQNYSHFKPSSLAKLIPRATEGVSVVQEFLDLTLKPVKEAATADQFAFADLLLWVREHFNQRIDRMTMISSVEGRVPFQDNSIVDMALTIRVSRKFKGTEQKTLLREAYKDILPDFVLNRPKRPFAAPGKAWLEGILNEYALSQLNQSSFKGLGLFDGRAVESFAYPFLRGENSHYEENEPFISIWNLLALTIWLKQWNISS
ncbi:MAG: asparagine synthase (glutamine-hydrolyzing) [Chloroflexi bacterium]|uniref:asparagine synthase (glutamine-hydrolyzing) n=1 Tax=Candidatus Chlorohelix allophototropha TaxID=3003348 RepID=A0A8T7LXR2_9CHLR|nr:asparagine synthase (glutamine-hydrolyzing) [Chloroflexota bacterium]WJW67546.1 asparagine synthase (glutamine-hydrolyzing) [Chloroflexota bacterium L227-S17]